MRSQKSFLSLLNKEKAGPTRDSDRLCCSKCRFSTRNMDLFQRHMSHHKEVMFSCTFCSHVSYSITESQKHVVSHTGLYPYRCSFCSYGAVRRDYMIKHIQRIHKRPADKGCFTHYDESILPSRHPLVTHRTSGWPEKTEHCMNPSAPSPSIGNAHGDHASGSQQRTRISTSVSKSSNGHSNLTGSATRQHFTSPTPALSVAQTQLTGTAPSYNINHQLGNTLLAVPRSGQENGTVSSSAVSGDGQVGKVGSCNPTSEKPIQKAALTRVLTQPPLKSNRSVVPEKTMNFKCIPKVRVQLPVEMTSPLRPLLNIPVGTAQNVLADHRVSQSITGTNILTSQKKSSTAAPLNSPIKHSERSSQVSLQKDQTTEQSSRSRTTPIILRRPSVKKASPLSSVQVELLAPLNQPIERNEPLTVSCPEEINIPAGCLVELVEVKNVNGTRELELRLIPPNGTVQDRKHTDGSTPYTVESEMSFKCQFASESMASPSKSSKEKQQSLLTCTDGQSIRSTHQKPEWSFNAAVQNMGNQNQKSSDSVFKPSAKACEGSEVFPVISSVFSLCPTPAPTTNVSQIKAEFHDSSLQTNRPQVKLQGELKMVLDQEYKMAAMKVSKENVQSTERSVVCSFSIKNEEMEEKYKIEDIELKESKTECEKVEEMKTIQTSGQEKTRPETTLDQCSNKFICDLKENPNVINPLMPSKKNNNLSPDKRDLPGLVFPKVALVRIPNSLLEPNKKVVMASTQEESLTARPVLYCRLTEENMSRGHEGAIKLILKRDFPEDQNSHAPPRKKHKKERTKKHELPLASMSFQRDLPKHHELRLTPLKEDQLVKLPGPNQPVVVLNHPSPSVQMVNIGVQTLKNYKWIRSVHHRQEQMDLTVSKQPSLKMKLKKVHGQKYRVIELVVRGVNEKLLNL